MNYRNLFYLLSILGACACSSGSSSDPTGDIIDRSGRSIGAISAFGSVVVNGVAYDTSSAIITVDDQPGLESDLAVGQVVVLDGLVDANGSTGTAERILVDPALRGPITDVDVATNTLLMLGTQVKVTSATVFDTSVQPPSLDSLSTGDVIDVYGYLGSDGSLTATLLARSADTEIEIRGLVTNLDTTTLTFVINALPIDYSNAVLVGFDEPLANGDLVEVEGVDQVNGALVAQRLENEASATFTSDDESTEVSIEGLVTRFAGVDDFDVNGIQVTTTAATEYEAGSAQDLALDSRVEVEGVINASGVLVAEEVDFELEINLEALGSVEAVDAAAGTVTVLGLNLQVTPTTQLIDESDAQLQFFSLADVAPGDFVKIKASTDGATTTLDIFKRTSPEDKDKLKGSVTAIAQPIVFVGSAQIETDDQTSFSGGGPDEFFATLAVGDTVSAEGQSTVPGVLTAESIEIE